MPPDRSAGVQQGREWTILVCPVCGEREEDDHLCEHLSGDWSDAGVWIPAKHEAETVRVVEAVSPEPREQDARGVIRGSGTPQSPLRNPRSPEPREGEREKIQAKIDAEAKRWRYGWRMDPAGKIVPRDHSVASVLRLTASRLRDPEYRWSVDPAVTLEHLAERLEGTDDG